MALILMTWYGVARKCECDTDGNLYQFAFSADGEFLFSFYCPKCKKPFHWRIYASQLQHDALCRDVVKSRRGKVIPESIIPPEKLSDKDKKLLHDFGIDEEGLK